MGNWDLDQMIPVTPLLIKFDLPREQPLFHPKIPNEREPCVNKRFSSRVGRSD